MEQQLKPFDLNRGLNGGKMVTRDGGSVIKIAYSPEAMPSQRVVALIGTEACCTIYHYYENGEMHQYAPNHLDIFMAPTEKDYWMVSYSSSINARCLHTSSLLNSEKQATEWIDRWLTSGEREPCIHKITRLE